MSQCKYCKAEIFWTYTDSYKNRYAKPLEKSGEAYTITIDSISVKQSIFKIHKCKEREETLIREKENREEHFRQIDKEYEIKRNKLMKRAWDKALQVSCPTCGAYIGTRCVNLYQYTKNNAMTETSWPHKERIKAYNVMEARKSSE